MEQTFQFRSSYCTSPNGTATISMAPGVRYDIAVSIDSARIGLRRCTVHSTPGLHDEHPIKYGKIRARHEIGTSAAPSIARSTDSSFAKIDVRPGTYRIS
eukprot:IDg21487t1